MRGYDSLVNHLFQCWNLGAGETVADAKWVRAVGHEEAAALYVEDKHDSETPERSEIAVMDDEFAVCVVNVLINYSPRFTGYPKAKYKTLAAFDLRPVKP